jgi:hypothetical protein
MLKAFFVLGVAKRRSAAARATVAHVSSGVFAKTQHLASSVAAESAAAGVVIRLITITQRPLPTGRCVGI